MGPFTEQRQNYITLIKGATGRTIKTADNIFSELQQMYDRTKGTFDPLPAINKLNYPKKIIQPLNPNREPEQRTHRIGM